MTTEADVIREALRDHVGEWNEQAGEDDNRRLQERLTVALAALDSLIERLRVAEWQRDVERKIAAELTEQFRLAGNRLEELAVERRQLSERLRVAEEDREKASAEAINANAKWTEYWQRAKSLEAKLDAETVTARSAIDVLKIERDTARTAAEEYREALERLADERAKDSAGKRCQWCDEYVHAEWCPTKIAYRALQHIKERE